MDGFEKEYKGKVVAISSHFKTRRHELAKSRIKLFAASLYRQLRNAMNVLISFWVLATVVFL